MIVNHLNFNYCSYIQKFFRNNELLILQPSNTLRPVLKKKNIFFTKPKLRSRESEIDWLCTYDYQW